MTNIYGGRRRKTSISVLVPYLLMFLIGLSTGYALWGYSSKTPAPLTTASAPEVKVPSEPAAPAPDQTAPVAPAQPAAVPPSPAPKTAAAPAVDETPAVAPKETLAPADTVGVWPGRHLFIAVKGENLDDDAKAMLREVRPGGVVLLGGNVKNRAQVIKLVQEIKEAAGLGVGLADLPLIAVDQEGGKINRLRLENAPSAAELGAKEDADAQKVGREYAAACVARGIGVLLAPVMDIYEKDVSPATFEDRAFGTKGDTVTTHALAFAAGVADGGVIAVAKHFPGHGASSQDTHDALAVLDRSGYELAKVMFPFAEAARVGTPGIMVGHIAVPVLENGVKRPASLSPVIIKSVLRKRLEFRGVVIADDLDMGAIKNDRSVDEAVVESLAAGCDVAMYLDPSPDRIRAVCAAINDAVTAGKLARADLSESVRRLEGWQTFLRKSQGLPAVESATTLAKGPEPAPPAPVTPPTPAPSTPAPSVEPKPASEAKAEQVVPVVPPAEEATPPEPAPSAPKGGDAAPKEEPTTTGEGEFTVDITKDKTIFVDGKAVAEEKLAEVLGGQSAEIKKKTLLVRPDASLGQHVSKKVLDIALEAGFVHRGVTSLAPSRAEELAKLSAPAETASAPLKPGALGWPFSPPETPAAKPDTGDASSVAPAAPAPDASVYEVQKGDSLTKVAAKAGVKAADIQAWNNLTSDTIQAGQKLIVRKPDEAPAAEKPKAEKPAVAKKEDASAPDAEPAKKDKEKDKKKDKDKETDAEQTAKKEKTPADTDVPQPPNTKKVIHEIQPGEMLSKIAAKYHVKQKDIIGWNKLEDDDIKYGRKLVIFTPTDASEPADKDAATKTPPAAAEPAPAPAEPAPSPAAAPAEPAPTAPAEPAPAPAPAEPAEPAPAPTAPQPAPDEAAKAAPPDTAAPAPAAAPPADGVKWIHTVARGQKLADIAAQYGVSVDAIKQWNGLADDELRKGQKLSVYLSSTAAPENANVKRADKADKASAKTTEPYIVQSGDSLDKIAEKFSISREELLELNRMNNASQLRPGQRIKVPKQP
ncbi:MAG: LysM peptidoglycan-binding domain-containing protein [Candidatus Hydrogenedentes bacterium]|nr:LysM peptidoglycan-binding domain-containing protein [Candidatus Hydrogenedentota bacterium]